MKQKIGLIPACILVFQSACIENDIPYPRIKAEILSIEAEGQLEAPVINAQDRTVHFSMDEEVNMEKIQIRKLEVTEGATISPAMDSTSIIDLSSPKEYILTIYQDYEWTFSAEQVIDRYFKVNNQLGAEVIDVKNKIAIAYVEEGTDISSITIERLKLGPASATIVPDMATIKDFTKPGGVTVVVIYRNIRDVWTLFVAEREETCTLSVDAWERVAWLYGEGKADGVNGFEYRESGSENWIQVNSSLVQYDGGVFKSRISGLTEGKTYISRAYSDEDYSAEISFTMGTTEQLPNSSFENWHQSGKTWYIYGEDEDMFWDSGNQGAATLGASYNVTTPDQTYVKSGAWSAKLESNYIVLKFAAGNIFTGKYIKTQTTKGALIDFGRPFTKHPSKLRGWYRYQPGIIDRDQSENTLPASLVEEGAEMGKRDKGHIWVILRDADGPIRIDNTNRPAGLYNYKTDPYAIAYGELIQHDATTGSGLVEFEFELEYFHTDRTPTYIAIVASASKYGDYFMGSSESILWLDDFELVYD